MFDNEENAKIINGNCLDEMKKLDENSVDSIVTDPPYGLEFMGKEWDAPWKQTSGGFSSPGIGERKTDWPSYKGSNRVRCQTCGMLIGQGGSRCKCSKPKPLSQDAERMRTFQDWTYEWAVEALRVIKPGGHILVFGGTRTYHRVTSALEDAGWEIRDCIMWVYGSGFPKSHNVASSIDKSLGHPNRGKAIPTASTYQACDVDRENKLTSNPVGPYEAKSEQAKPWEGWGTALKPAWEPIIVARKPLIGTVAENVLAHGTGAMNIDKCRVGNETIRINTWDEGAKPFGGGAGTPYTGRESQGRWPANFIHDGSEEVESLFPEVKTGVCPADGASGYSGGLKRRNNIPASNGGDSGSAARFFYCSKANKKDRDEGLDDMEAKEVLIGAAGHKINPMTGKPVVDVPRKNIHPTVKPTDLMRYLCRLVTPPNGIVMDPFMGSGSTGKAAIMEGFLFVGIELQKEYIEIATNRIKNAKPPETKATLEGLME